MDYFDRTARCWLDSFRGSRPGLIVAAVFACVFLFPLPVFAANMTYSQAMSACQSQLASNQAANRAAGYSDTFSCVVDSSNPQVINLLQNRNGSVILDNSYVFTGSPPPTGCAAVADAPGTMQSPGRAQAAAAMSCDTSASSGVSGYSGCVESFSPGVGIANAYGGTVFAGTFHATGTACTMNSDGSFTAQSAGSSTPSPAAATPGKTPQKSCGGGSCVDPSTGQACVVDQSGTQFCTPTGSAIPPSSPNCYSDGSSATLCVGSSPLMPGNPPVTDAAKQIASTDTYNVSTPTANTTTTVNVYNTSTGTTSSGQGSTDSGPAGGGQGQSTNPAHASSAGGNGTLSGGTDCNSPPVCTGDSVLCGIARTQWSTTCQVHRDLAGTSTPVPTSPPSPSDVWQDGTVTGDSEADNANQGNYNTTGFGYSQQCPLKDITFTVMGSTITVPMQDKCWIGGWLKALVLGFAFFAAAKITAGGVG